MHIIYRCKLSTNMKRPQTFQKIVSYHIEWDSFNSITFMIDRSNAVNLENMSYPFVCLHTTSQFCLFALSFYARHTLPLISKGSLSCNTCFDTGHLLIMVSPSTRDTHTCLPSVWQWSHHYLYLRHRSVASGIQKPNLSHSRQTL